jgi:hypothetical protein
MIPIKNKSGGIKLETVYVTIRYGNFWWGEYGLCDKEGNDEVAIYSDPNEEHQIGYFDISTHVCKTYDLEDLLDNYEDDIRYKKRIEGFLNGDAEIYYHYYYPRDEEDIAYQVNHAAPLNENGHKPTYINMWTKLSDGLDTNTIKDHVKIFAKDFLNMDVENVIFLDVPTFEETKESYCELFGDPFEE